MRLALLLLLALIMVGGVFANRRHLESRLLRADPEALVHDPMLRDFAMAAGKPLFDAHCAVCHGIKGRGDSDKGVPDLTDSDWLYGTGQIADIEQVIDYGIRSHNARAWNLAIMPAFARLHPSPRDSKILPLSPAEIADVIEFLFLQQGRASDSAAAVRGAGLYAGKGGCYDCHAFDGKGDSAIGAPNLTDAVTLYGDGGRDALFRSIAYGRQGMCPGWMKKIGPAGVRELAVFIHSLSSTGASSHAE